MSLTGSEVVAKHKSAVAKCKNTFGWAKLECIVNSMRAEYGKD